MGDFGRAAHATLRSTSFLRHTPIRSGPCYNLALAFSTPARRHITATRSPSSQFAKPTVLPTAALFTNQRQDYSSWAKPTRLTRENPDGKVDRSIKKPDSASYNIAFSEGGKGDQPAFASDLLDDFLDVKEVKAKHDATAAAVASPRLHLHLAPRTGRTIRVKPNGDVAQSFKLLNNQIAHNRVPQDFKRQKFHERPGLKRKRLKSERWQRRFKLGFKAVVSRVQELKAQGW